MVVIIFKTKYYLLQTVRKEVIDTITTPPQLTETIQTMTSECSYHSNALPSRVKMMCDVIPSKVSTNQETAGKNCCNKHNNSSKVIKQESRTRRWNVTMPKPLPSFGLDKIGSSQIHKSANYISQQIDKYLRLESICATFDNVNAKATCRTTNGNLHFQIYLYSDPVNNQSTHLEVLKIKGCGFTFIKQRKNIMNVAKGKGLVSSKQLKQSLVIPPNFLNSYVPPRKHYIESMIERASKRIGKSNSLDDIAFVLQNLMSLTTPDMNPRSKSAHWMSLLIMENQNHIRDKIISTYKQQTHQVSFSIINDEVSEKICNACITIFTNGMIAICKENEGKEYCLDQGLKDFFQELVPLLVEEVANCENVIMNACLALKCIEVLMCHSKLTYNMLRKTSRFEALVEKAKIYGMREHLKLENASNALLQIMC